MELIVTTKNFNDLEKPAFVNKALNHALRTVRLARELGLEKGERLIEASTLSVLTGKTTFILPGPESYGGAIKGDAALGFYEKEIHDRWVELENLEEKAGKDKNIRKELNEIKADFLVEHGIGKKEISQKMLDNVKILHVALWEGLKDSAFVTPTSGSFGLAFIETLGKLRDFQIDINGRKIHLLQDKKNSDIETNEGNVIVWAPHPDLNIMNKGKTELMQKEAERIGVRIEFWKEREKRDILALAQTLENGYIFAPTNPKNYQEIRELLEQIKSEKGTDIFFTPKAGKTLASMGVAIDCKDDKVNISVNEELLGGVYGLAMIRLHQLEGLLKKNIKNDTSYDQPSVGATFAASKLMDDALISGVKLSDENRKLLYELFPRIHKKLSGNRGILPMDLDIHGSPDNANISFAQALGYKGAVYPTSSTPENGLGTITTGMACIEITQMRIGKADSFKGGKNFHPVPKIFMHAARPLMFAALIASDDKIAKYPEGAGAASLGGLLYQLTIEEKKLTSYDISWIIRKSGIDNEIFEGLQSEEKIFNNSGKKQYLSGIEYLRKESAINGGEIEKFAKEFLVAMQMNEAELEQKISPVVKNWHPANIDKTSSITVFDTGSNGTEILTRKYKKQISDNQKDLFLSMSEPGKGYKYYGAVSGQNTRKIAR